MDEKLRELADRLGIATAYTDCGLKAACHEVSDETVRFFAGVLGYKAGSGEEIARSLRALDNRRWQTALEPVYVIPRSRKVFDVVVPENEIEGDFGLSVVSRQTGEKSEVSFVVVTLPERRTVGKKTYGRLEIEITSDLAVGYYDAELSVGENSYRTLLAIAPEKCWQPDGWDKASVARYWALLAACDQLEVLEDHYSPGCMLRRNREMLRRAQLLISVYDGTPGGTASTVRLAEQLGIEVLPLWM